MVDSRSALFSVVDDNALHCQMRAVTTLKLVTIRLASTLLVPAGRGLALSLRWEMAAEFNRKSLMWRSSWVASKTPLLPSELEEESWGVLVLVVSLRSSGWGKVTRGGDRAARSCRSLQGVLVRLRILLDLLLEETKAAARFCKKSLKLSPSNVA